MDLVFAVHATGLNEHVRTRRASGQTWSTEEQRHGLGRSGGFRKKACEDLSSMKINSDTSSTSTAPPQLIQHFYHFSSL